MTKTELHELVDALPDESLPAAAILLRRAQDSVVAKLDAAPYALVFRCTPPHRPAASTVEAQEIR